MTKFHLVLVQEILGHRALDRLTIFQLQREGLQLSWSPGHVTDSILPPHGSAVGDLDLQSFDLLRELDSLRIRQGFSLLVDVTNVQDFAHEFDDRLCLVKGSGRDVTGSGSQDAR